jgi:hypothetical protein
LTSSIVVPFDRVFDKIVWIAPIWVSYSRKPLLTGSIVSAETSCLPVRMAFAAMSSITCRPMRPISVNECAILFTPSVIVSNDSPLLSAFRSSMLLRESLKLVLSLLSNAASDFWLCAIPRSN